jgi:SAM-dependent methyltransferase
MNRYWTMGHRLPPRIAAYLFGNRTRFGLEIQEQDVDWQTWQTFYLQFYQQTQKQGIGAIVNNAGYTILRYINMQHKHILEVGPGVLPHINFWNGKPDKYSIVDINQTLLERSMQVLQSQSIHATAYLSHSIQFPLEDQQVDAIFSFYSLEHLYPLHPHLEEMKRVLKPEGLLVGAIPAEGGLAWGSGRFLVSRRYIKKHTTINPDKIICWEHPNYAETILHGLDHHFERVFITFWPFAVPLIDLNLVVSFVYKKHCMH